MFCVQQQQRNMYRFSGIKILFIKNITFCLVYKSEKINMQKHWDIKNI